ncbi:PH domain-containing protein [Microbacterium sp. YY-01]|uniref:PH domain-containing protein n=1 Tax=Microbacterium sp. YY-01 TaxID=3421634 RepID=UPI003D16B213
MTNVPGFHQGEVPPSEPAPAAAPHVSGAASAAAADGTANGDAVLDDGTYTQLREPRSAGALRIDGEWHQISPRYAVSQIVQNLVFVAVLIIAALVLSLGFEQWWAWIPAGALTLITLVTIVIVPRQARAIGYMLRSDDIVFRRGILWQRMIAVPYGRMQLVDITRGPVDRMFRISTLKMVTAAATTGVEIPGLTEEASEALRDTLIDVAETRRTGL